MAIESALLGDTPHTAMRPGGNPRPKRGPDHFDDISGRRVGDDEACGTLVPVNGGVHDRKKTRPAMSTVVTVPDVSRLK